MKSFSVLIRRVVAVVMACMLMLPMVYMERAEAAAFSLKYLYANTAEITAQMDDLKSIFPNNKYWNGGKSEKQLKDAIARGDFSAEAMGVTSAGCKWNDKDADESGPNGEVCTPNKFGDATQCYGFSNIVGYMLFPEDGIPNSEWVKYKGKKAKNLTLEPGDVVRMGGHSGVVWKISGGKVYLAQVWGNNGTGTKGSKNYTKPKGCIIKWTTWEGGEEYDTQAELLTAVAKSDNNWVCKHPGSKVSAGSSVDNRTPILSITDPTKPSTINCGDSFGIRGTIKTDCGMITKVYGEIKDAKGKVVQSATFTPNAASHNLKNSLNDKLLFGKLGKGTYTYKVTAVAKNGSKVSKETTLIEKQFTVVAKAPKFTVTTEFKAPTTLEKGSNFGLRGVVKIDRGSITDVGVWIINSKGKTVLERGICPGGTGKTHDIRTYVNNWVKFGSLAKGTYTYKVVIGAENYGEKSSYTYTKKFTIK